MELMSFAETKMHGLLSALSSSPFESYMHYISEFPCLKYINYFVPVGTIISITETWVTAIGIFYLYSIVLRWVKAIS